MCERGIENDITEDSRWKVKLWHAKLPEMAEDRQHWRQVMIRADTLLGLV